MSIRGKTLLAVIGTFLALIAILYAILQAVVLGRYELLEEQAVRADIERALAAIEREARQMEALNYDWATWDDTYEFVGGRNPSYVGSNLMDETFVQQRLSLMLFVDASGNAVYAKAFDREAGEEVPVPEGLIRRLTPEWVMGRTAGSPGIVEFDGRLMLVTSRPIMTSANAGPPQGSLVMGRMMDAAWTENLSRTVRLPVAFRPNEGAGPGQAGGITVRALSPDTISGSASLEAAYGAKVAVEALQPRTLYRQGRADTFYFLLYFVLSGVVVCAVCLVIIEKTVLSRLSRLISRAGSIGATADASMRVGAEAGGSDEVAALATGIDGMLASIERFQNEGRRAADELRRSEERLRSVLEASRDLVWEVNGDFVCTYMSPMVEEMLGYGPSAVVGRDIGATMAPADAASFRERIASAGPGDGPCRFECRLSRGDGGAVPVEVCSSRVLGPDGALSGYRGVFRDISAQLEAEDEKERVRDKLIHAQKMETVGRLAGGVAHDFNNILAIIKALCNLGLGSGGEREARKHLEEIGAAADRATNLTRQLLIFSRSRPMKRDPLDMNGVVDGLMGMLVPLVGENITIRTRLCEGLRKISADRGAMEQILINLVINARDAMPGCGVITVRTANEGADRIRIEVQDTGCGMDEAAMARIFEPFYSTKEAGKGMGLGLAVTRDIVADHGGQISVSSRKGAGTRLTVLLPSNSEEAPTARPTETESASPAGAGEKILLVEDEKLLRESVAMVLERHGFRVSQAGSAREALDIFEECGGDFDLVFTDIMMKGKSGIDLAVALVREKPGVRMLFTSGYMDIESQWPFIKENGFPFIQKPYGVNELVDRVARLVRAEPGGPEGAA